MPHTSGPSPRIYYEVEGDADHPPIVLIEGLSAQLVGWRAGFRRLLLDRGLRLILLDNRDVGLSDKCGGPRDDGLAYSIRDMADDVARVLDACGERSAHIVGQSMGGAIAQAFAVHHRDRIRSLTLFYTAPSFEADHIGEATRSDARRPTPDASRAIYIEERVAGERLCASPAYGFDEAWVRIAAGLSYDRCPRTDGYARQRAALLQTADHRSSVGGIAVPTTILHGREDRIVAPAAGLALAALMPQADLHLYAGLGHVVAEPVWPQFAAVIDGVVKAGEERRGGRSK